jgi:DNA-binding LytR/AlgR family response regulator
MLKPFFVWEDKMLKKINPDDVLCLSTEGNYTRIYLADKTFYMVRSSLSGALKKLPPDVFIRVHRSFVASLYHIESINKDHLLVGDEPLPIGKQYYKSLIDKLNIIE